MSQSIYRRGEGALLNPASLAVVGASADPTKWGHWLARGALRGAHRRSVTLVNNRGGSVLGQPSFRHLDELLDVPEMVALAVPPSAVDSVVRAGLARGVSTFLCVASGVPDEAALLADVRAAGARIIGPNSLGIYDAENSLELAWGHFHAGPLAVITQSGQVGSEIVTLADRAGIGTSRFVSVGNQGDVTLAETLHDLVGHRSTRAVAVYVEGITQGDPLLDALRDLGEAGVPTLVLSTGGSEASRQLAQTHTGSVTSDTEVLEAACRSVGALRVATPAQLVAVAATLLSPRPPRGRRVAVVSDSGGQGGIAADVATRCGLQVPPLSPAMQARLADLLPQGAAVANPVDLAGGGDGDLATYALVVEEIAGSGEVDAVVLSGYFGSYGEDVPTSLGAELTVADRLAAPAAAPLVVHAMSPHSSAVVRLREKAVPVYTTIDDTMSALDHGITAGALRPRPPRGPGDRAALVVDAGYWSARTALSEHGIAFPAGALVGSGMPGDGLRPPYVLKAGGLEHKTDHGGVRVGLADLDGLAAALVEMTGRLGAGEYVVEEQDLRPDVVELLVGARRDPVFGPTVTVARGGTETELHRDAVLELGPVDHDTALGMIARLRCAPLLDGWRGAPPLDLAALADTVVTVSEVLAASPHLSEIELNPVRVGPSGVLAVDALVVPSNPRSST